MKKLLAIIKNKWLINGTKTLILAGIIIAVYIAIIIFISNNTLPSLDLTEKKLYSLSAETKTKLDNLEEDVTIELINFDNYEYGINYAKKYEAYSKKVKVETIDDLTTRTDLMTKYNLSAEDNLIVVKTEETETTITLNELYTYDYNTSQQIDLTEEALTNAIMQITVKDKPKVYILKSNSAYEYNALNTMLSGLQADANETEELDLLSKGNIPEDCSVLILRTQKDDITELERDKIFEYIEKGGKILALTSQNIIDAETPNLNSVYEKYGITIEKGIIIEQDPNKMLSGSPEFIISEIYPGSSITQKLDMSINMCSVDAGVIKFAEQETLDKIGVTYEPIAQAGSDAFLRKDFTIQSMAKTAQDETAENALIAASVTKKINDEMSSQLVIFSSEMFALDMRVQVAPQYYMYAAELYNNNDVVLNSISYLNNRTDTITIRKTGETENYTVTETQNTIILIIIFTVPVLIIIAGIVVWQLRRRKK